MGRINKIVRYEMERYNDKKYIAEIIEKDTTDRHDVPEKISIDELEMIR